MKTLEACQIYVILPQILNPGVLRDLQQGLQAEQVSCLLCFPPIEKATLNSDQQEIFQDLKNICHRHNVALLVENDADFAKTVEADGVHLNGDMLADVGNYAVIKQTLGQGTIVGALCDNRHQSLIWGEEGADYIAFPAEQLTEQLAQEQTEQDGTSPNKAHIKWWSELVEIPCVAWNVAEREMISYQADLGADFVSMPMDLWYAFLVMKTETK